MQKSSIWILDIQSEIVSFESVLKVGFKIGLF